MKSTYIVAATLKEYKPNGSYGSDPVFSFWQDLVEDLSESLFIDEKLKREFRQACGDDSE
jgi:hypothetical protein